MTPIEKKAIKQYGKDLAAWIIAHPDRDWIQELYDDTHGVQTQDDGTGGDRPPKPPINP